MSAPTVPSPLPAPRLAAIASSGRFVALRQHRGLDVVDVQGVAPRVAVELSMSGEFAWVGGELWTLDRGRLARCSSDGRSLGTAILIAGATRLAAASGSHVSHVLVTGAAPAFVETRGDDLVTHLLSDRSGAAWYPLAGRTVLRVADGHLATQVAGRDAAPLRSVGEGASVVAAASLFGGRTLCVVVRDQDGDAAWVMQPGGAMIHRLRLPRGEQWAFARERGVLVVGGADRDLTAADLRLGRVTASSRAPHAICEVVLDDDGRRLVLAGPANDAPAIVTLASFDEVFHGPVATAIAAHRDDHLPPRADDLDDVHDLGDLDHGDLDLEEALDPPAVTPVADDEPEPPMLELDVDLPAIDVDVDADEVGAAAPTIVDPAAGPLPDTRPLALGVPRRAPAVRDAGDARPYGSPAEHIADLLDLVAARAALAIAVGWHSGRIAGELIDALPGEREVTALAGDDGEWAGPQVDRSVERLARRSQAVAARVVATLAGGRDLPFPALARELELDAVATQVLLVVMAPALRGELTRLYRVVGNDPTRPVCDRTIVELILGGDVGGRDRVAAALSPEAALIRWGLVRQGERGALTVDDVLLDRVRGQARHAELSSATVLRHADRVLDDLVVDRAAVIELLGALARPRGATEPVRLVVRGRRGIGRHTLVASLAARVGRSIACIDASRLPRTGAALASALRDELVRAVAAGALPVVSGVDGVDRSEPESSHLVRQVLDAHCGPIALRTSLEAEVPLSPGYLDLTMAALSERARAACWGAALARAGLTASVDALAARYRVGPGTIERIVTTAAAAPDAAAGDATPRVDAVARQHIAARMGSVAQRVQRLARWDQVALPEDILDSLRELIGRARHARTVFEDWGYDDRIATARGLTALFYGPPGTGKTMVAGLIARELGLDLYRVDLANVMSKWVGETEKNLGEVFDAAEDGQIMLLFDEADSLFARRTEVKSSNDRYANLEVNYLLQRLDSFTGVAVLTTNLEGSIDPAFKRRLSMRLYFPFPDEEMRARLWAAHVPARTPTAGRLDFADLGRRFQLSGGYIRNSALRAAFLAAHERRPLDQDHLVRAVHLEYRELGKLARDGRME